MTNETVQPFIFVVFGGTGDLMRRKLLPALYRLTERHIRNVPYRILGVARKPMTEEAYRTWADQALEEAGLKGDAMRWCREALFYQTIGEGTAADYAALKERIASLEASDRLPGNRVFYLAIPPVAYPSVIEAFGEHGLNRSVGWTRLVIEKPFGYDLESARKLNEVLHRYFHEQQIFRIDHYLGKETVQNLFVFRFANYIFETSWNRERVALVQITVAEDLGVGRRAGYYDRTGALRDMVQNHLTQLLTLTAMEAPVRYDAAAVRFEKIKVLRAIRPIVPEDVVFGQYTSGKIHGKPVPGYRDEPGVAGNSQTETFVAMRLWVDTWRWQGVPFYLRTGKRMAQKRTQIVIRFRRPPVCLFESMGKCMIHSNTLEITLQPKEGFRLLFDIKEPGEPLNLRELPLDFVYRDVFKDLPDAYETLLLDVLVGDATLFVHADEVEASWALYTPLLEADLPLHLYPAGSWGPEAAHRLIQQHDVNWWGDEA